MTSLQYTKEQYNWRANTSPNQDPGYWRGLRPLRDLVREPRAYFALATAMLAVWMLIPQDTAHAQSDAPENDLCQHNPDLLCTYSATGDGTGILTIEPEDPTHKLPLYPVTAINALVEAADDYIKAAYPHYDGDNGHDIHHADYCPPQMTAPLCLNINHDLQYGVKDAPLHPSFTPTWIQRNVQEKEPYAAGPDVPFVKLGLGREVPMKVVLDALDRIYDARIDANGRISNPEDIATLARQALAADKIQEQQPTPTEQVALATPTKEPIQKESNPETPEPEQEKLDLPLGTITAAVSLLAVIGITWGVVGRVTNGDGISLPELPVGQKPKKAKSTATILGKPEVPKSPESEEDIFYHKYDQPAKARESTKTLDRIRALNEIDTIAREEARRIIDEDDKEHRDWFAGLQNNLNNMLRKGEAPGSVFMQQLEVSKESHKARELSGDSDKWLTKGDIREELIKELNDDTKWPDPYHDY